jgi:hypothetical protein
VQEENKMNLIYALMMVGTATFVFTGLTLFSNFFAASNASIVSKIKAISQEENNDLNSFDLTRKHTRLVPHQAIDVAVKNISAQTSDVKSLTLEMKMAI